MSSIPIFVRSNHFYSVAKSVLRSFGMILTTAGALLFTGSSLAAGNDQSEAMESYRAQYTACMKIGAKQDRATCLKEMAAARQADKRGKLVKPEEDYVQNALQRCYWPGQDTEACIARMLGMGQVSGSVAEGGIYRELPVIEVVVPQQRAMPSTTQPSGMPARGYSR